MFEMKNTLYGTNDRLDIAEERINELEKHRNYPEWNTERKKRKQKQSKLWDNFKEPTTAGLLVNPSSNP